MRRKLCSVTTLALLLMILGGVQASSAFASIIQVDQENPITNATGSISIGGSREYGQSFTPTLTGIDAFEFFAGEELTAASWTIQLRDGSITGTILGVSNPVSGAFADNDPIKFVFPSTIALTPGNLYVAEILFSTGGAALAWGPDLYPGGTFVSTFTSFDRDYAFREGLTTAVPEPSSALLCLMGLAALRLRRRRE